MKQFTSYCDVESPYKVTIGALTKTGEECPPNAKTAEGAIPMTGSLAPARTPATIRLASAATMAFLIIF